MQSRRKTDGSIVYREKVYVDGIATYSPWFSQKTHAKNWKAKTISERQQQKSTGITYNPKISLSKFSDKWFQEKVCVRNARKTQESYRSYLDRYILPVMGKVPIGELNYRHGNILVSKLKDKGLYNKTNNVIVGIVKTILNDAVRWNYIPKNGLWAFQELQEDISVFKYWTMTEVSQFLRANISDPLYPLWAFLVNTGTRKGEALGLCWDRVDFIKNQIHITRKLNRYGLQDTTKTGLKRIIPFSPNGEIKRILTNLMKQQKGQRFVFCDDAGEHLNYDHTGKAFRLAQERAGFSEFIRVHDLRHTFASQFMMNQGHLFTLQKLLGHTTIDMTMKYAHFGDDYLRDAIGVISFSGLDENEKSSPKIVPAEEKPLQLGLFSLKGG